jgi:hypothetical protein
MELQFNILTQEILDLLVTKKRFLICSEESTIAILFGRLIVSLIFIFFVQYFLFFNYAVSC